MDPVKLTVNKPPWLSGPVVNETVILCAWTSALTWGWATLSGGAGMKSGTRHWWKTRDVGTGRLFDGSRVMAWWRGAWRWYYEPAGTLWTFSVSHEISHNSSIWWELSSLKVEPLNLRMLISLRQHLYTKWWRQDLNPGLLNLEFVTSSCTLNVLSTLGVLTILSVFIVILSVLRVFTVSTQGTLHGCRW